MKSHREVFTDLTSGIPESNSDEPFCILYLFVLYTLDTRSCKSYLPRTSAHAVVVRSGAFQRPLLRKCSRSHAEEELMQLHGVAASAESGSNSPLQQLD